MLMDLSKEIMMDLGITVIGDIIAILKHAKLVYRQVRRDRRVCFGAWTVSGDKIKCMKLDKQGSRPIVSIRPH